MHSLDVEVNASGFSKSIKEFDEALEELEKNKEDEEDEETDNEDDEEDNSQSDNEYDEHKVIEDSINSSNNESAELGAVGNTSDESKLINNPTDENEELYDKFDENLHLSNKQYRAYRDQKEGENVSSEEDDDDDRLSCSTTTSTIMDPKTVRGKCRKGILKKIKTERRRIRNKGESALVTEKNREINDDIKASIHFFN